MLYLSLLAAYLERLYEGPQESANALPSTEQFHEPHYSEQTEEIDTNNTRTSLQKKVRWRNKHIFLRQICQKMYYIYDKYLHVNDLANTYTVGLQQLKH